MRYSRCHLRVVTRLSLLDLATQGGRTHFTGLIQHEAWLQKRSESLSVPRHHLWKARWVSYGRGTIPPGEQEFVSVINKEPTATAARVAKESSGRERVLP